MLFAPIEMTCRMKMRAGCMLLMASLLGGCGFVGGAKPVVPVEQGITFYPVAKTPAPVVVLLPGCGGAQLEKAPEIVQREAAWLNGLGFTAVLFDFTRVFGLEHACFGQIEPRALLDSIAQALRYIAAQPSVDREHIALLGWSLGASAALTIAQKSDLVDAPPIAAVAAYYPGCYAGLELSTRPTLLLIGLADNVVKPYECIAMANRTPRAPLTLKMYRGVHHNFDAVDLKEPRTNYFLWKKFTAAYDPLAAADARQAVAEFLTRYNGASANR